MLCNCHGKCGTAKVAWVLVLIGGLNWGFIGLGILMSSNWNIVGMILGKWPMVEAIVYLLVGVCTLVTIFGCPCQKCKDAKMACMVCKVGADKPMSGSSM